LLIEGSSSGAVSGEQRARVYQQGQHTEGYETEYASEFHSITFTLAPVYATPPWRTPAVVWAAYAPFRSCARPNSRIACDGSGASPFCEYETTSSGNYSWLSSLCPWYKQQRNILRSMTFLVVPEHKCPRLSRLRRLVGPHFTGSDECYGRGLQGGLVIPRP
jgi:hypothetical protein